jgi:hypothetical protein
MKKLTSLLGGSLLLLLSATVFAEEHADAALIHAKEAVVSGKAGSAPEVIEHAETSLTHAKKAAQLAKGNAETHMKAAVKSLEEAITHAKLEHTDIATKLAEEAVQHIKEGNK